MAWLSASITCVHFWKSPGLLSDWTRFDIEWNPVEFVCWDLPSWFKLATVWIQSCKIVSIESNQKTKIQYCLSIGGCDNRPRTFAGWQLCELNVWSNVTLVQTRLICGVDTDSHRLSGWTMFPASPAINQVRKIKASVLHVSFRGWIKIIGISNQS